MPLEIIYVCDPHIEIEIGGNNPPAVIGLFSSKQPTTGKYSKYVKMETEVVWPFLVTGNDECNQADVGRSPAGPPFWLEVTHY